MISRVHARKLTANRAIHVLRLMVNRASLGLEGSVAFSVSILVDWDGSGSVISHAA